MHARVQLAAINHPRTRPPYHHTHACRREGKVWEGKTLLVTPSLLASAFSSMPVCYCMPDSPSLYYNAVPLKLLNQIMLLMSELHIAALL
eukprot:COSAG06_NODE_571_length_14101_cov_12.481682_16_plen_90_part_00